MPRKKLTPQQAKAMLMADGMDFQEDFHALSSSAVQALADVAKLAGYRKSKNAPGSTVRMFYQYLTRVEPVIRRSGELTQAERRAYQARARRSRQAPRPITSSHATKKKSPAQLDREIADVVPGWAKGLDLSESRALAKRLHVSQEELEAKKRRIESDRRSALPSLAITDAGDGIFVRVSPPGPGYGRYHAVVDTLKAFQIPIGNAIPPNIFVPVHKTADKTKARAKVEEALRYAGYRV